MIDNTAYIGLSWNQTGEYTFELAKKILASEKKFDRVIAIAKGGWTWTRALVDYLDIDSIASLRIQSYKDVRKATKPQIIQPLTDSVGGLDLLLFDEVIDTGLTIKHAKSYLKSMGAKSVRVATLCYKPRLNCACSPGIPTYVVKLWDISSAGSPAYRQFPAPPEACEIVSTY